jgi:uncharacterized OsmC-like protein
MTHHPVKRWSINAVSSPGRPLAFFRDGFPLVPGAGAGAEISPVEYLLVAAAAGFALSVRSVIGARKLPRTSFEVVVTGDKAGDLPSRLGQISLVVLFDGAVDSIEATRIAEEAKRLCTVTNTLVGHPNVDVKAGNTRALPAGHDGSL